MDLRKNKRTGNRCHGAVLSRSLPPKKREMWGQLAGKRAKGFVRRNIHVYVRGDEYRDGSVEEL